MARPLALALAVALVGYPLLIASSTTVTVLGVAALTLCVLGILFSTPLLVVGAVLALGEYALALWLRAAPPRLGGAVLLGVGLLLLLEAADFARRARRATLGPGVAAAQVWHWAVSGTLAGSIAAVAIVVASVASASARLPWAPALAAAGAVVALVAVAIVLTRQASRPASPGSG